MPFVRAFSRSVGLLYMISSQFSIPLKEVVPSLKLFDKFQVQIWAISPGSVDFLDPIF